MTTQNQAEIKGKLEFQPVHELLWEIAQNGFDGCARLQNGELKTMVYFREGKVIFAVSNARVHRLYEILLRQNKIDRRLLSTIPDFVNDVELAKNLVGKLILSEESRKEAFAFQTKAIISTALQWTTGEWAFTPLVRLREDLSFEVDIQSLLNGFVKTMTEERKAFRLNATGGKFTVCDSIKQDEHFSEAQGAIIPRLFGQLLTVEELTRLAGFEKADVAAGLYELWFRDLVLRAEWRSGFTEKQVSELGSIKVRRSKEATVYSYKAPVAAEPEKPIIVEAPAAETVSPDKDITVVDYLIRVEQSRTFYDILGVDSKAPASDIKRNYFALAKKFHPDLFRQTDQKSVATRVHEAFTKLAQAYETLRDAELREAYDFKVRKELEKTKKNKEQNITASEVAKKDLAEEANDTFEKGYSLMMDDHLHEALPLLARAATMMQNVARYRAHYGRILSFDSRQQHKAEAEMQAAIKLEPQNPTFRMMLAEFFVQKGFAKRAEGELTRLLSIAPNHREASILLDRIRTK